MPFLIIEVQQKEQLHGFTDETTHPCNDHSDEAQNVSRNIPRTPVSQPHQSHHSSDFFHQIEFHLSLDWLQWDHMVCSSA